MKTLGLAIAAVWLAAMAATNVAAQPASGRDGPTPQGIGARMTDLDGVVYVDAQGHTLYVWAADKPGQSACNDTRYVMARAITGQNYYLAGADTRPTCVQSWPPLRPSEGARPVGDWTIIQRDDGAKQWAFRGQPVYRSVLDEAPGDVNGMTSGPGDVHIRTPLGADMGFPPGVITRMTKWGRVLAPEQTTGILYVRDASQLEKADCDVLCRSAWTPFVAPALAEPQGDWSIVSPEPGLRQWAFKGKPLFMPVRVRNDDHLPPEEAPGWLPAIYRPMPAPPSDITVSETAAGLVYADRNGHTVYYFSCIDETPDRQFCDVQGTTPLTRVTLCGGPQKCMRTWRPVLASPNATAPNRTWTIVRVDPATGARIADSRSDGLSVWAYRGRPLYTFYGDKAPGDAYGNGVQDLMDAEFEMIELEFWPIRGDN